MTPAFAGIAALLALILAAPALAQGELHPAVPRHAGTWTGGGEGWSVTLEVTRRAITPERSVAYLTLACANQGGTRIQVWVSEGRVLDVLLPHQAHRGRLVRVAGVLPTLSVAPLRGEATCPAARFTLARTES